MVTSSEDILSVNDLLIENNNDHTAIITKIEKYEAIDELDEIIHASDGIMIDRESLGIEMPPERIPGISKLIISKCYLQSKISLVITGEKIIMEVIIVIIMKIIPMMIMILKKMIQLKLKM